MTDRLLSHTFVTEIKSKQTGRKVLFSVISSPITKRYKHIIHRNIISLAPSQESRYCSILTNVT